MSKTAPLSETEKFEKDRLSIINAYKHLMADCMEFTNQEERKQIRKAFDLCNEMHKNVRRKSGEPYILHPIAVARIAVKEIGLFDATSIVAALLHDVVEDTETTVDEIETLFGKTVAKIVDGLTKISMVADPSTSMQAESFRKMLLTMSDDVRVALIKIADRLHNMRTLKHMKPGKQLKIASETSYLYAPLAHRLGLYTIKSELEDLSLKYTEPEVYTDISRKVKASKEQRDIYIHNFIKPLKIKMAELGLKCHIFGRVKSINSIYEKMKRQSITFDEVYDVFAVRIVIDCPQETEKDDCRRAYFAVAESYYSHDGRMRDWVSKPKPSGYEAIHLTVMGPQGRWVEVQIRSVRMDYAAEKGMAAHWRYKDKSNYTNDDIFEEWVLKIRELLESRAVGGVDFVKEIKSELISDQIYVFTPKGEMKVMPVGATALDFAFEIHSNIGERCIGAKANYQIVPLSYVLENGDQIEILTSQRQQPQDEWLDFIKTNKARHKIREFLKEKRKDVIVAGKAIFDRKINRLGISLDHRGIKAFLAEFKLPNLEELYYRLGAHRIDARKVQEYIKLNLNKKVDKNDKNEDGQPEPPPNPNSHLFDYIQHTIDLDFDRLVIGSDVESARYRMAKCCKPIHGDEILAFAQGEEILVHRRDCSEVTALLSSESHKMVKVIWSEQQGLVEFLAGIRIEGHDKKKMLIEIIKVISTVMNINMRSITIGSEAGRFEGDIKLYVRDTDELSMIIYKLTQISGVTKVYRTDSES